MWQSACNCTGPKIGTDEIIYHIQKQYLALIPKIITEDLLMI
jgi:hypothetical protein